MQTEIQNLDFLKWGEWKVVQTKRGEKKVRQATPNDAFWSLWQVQGADLKRAGISVSKYDGMWCVSQWSEPLLRQQEVSEENVQSDEKADEVLDVEIPKEISDKLFPFQIESCKRLVAALKKYNAALDGSDLGSGKTYSAVAAAKTLGKKVAVVCPKAVIPSWHRACTHFGVQPEMILNYELVRNGRTAYGHWEGTGRSEKFVWDLSKDCMVIFDEIHKTKSATSINAKIALAALSQGYMVEGISGTIACNPTEMKVAGQIAKLHKGSDFYPWMKSNGVIKGRFGFFFNGSAKVLARINKQIYPEHGTRLKISEIPDFPETQITSEAYDCADNTGKIQDVYEQMYKELAEIETKEFESPGARKGAELAVQMFARQRAEMLKVPAAVQMIEDFIENGKSVVIFTNFRDTIEALSERLKTKCIVQGSQSAEEREKNVSDFQSDKEQVILVNIQSGGAGLSLHALGDARPRASIIFPSWSAVDFKQSTGRIHRAGANSKSIQRVLFAANTIEEDICFKVGEKLKNLSALMDADLSPKGIF